MPLGNFGLVPGARDACIVETGPLAELLQGFVASWNRDRPPPRPMGARRGPRPAVTPVGALSWLSSQTGIPAATIQNVVNGRYSVTELRVADPLVQALGRPDLFHDGTLRIRPNPNATARARASCECSGSGDALTGSF